MRKAIPASPYICPSDMHYRFIAVEGNIGAGKTTLARLLATHYGAQLLLEEFADNTFLPKFYKEPQRYAFPLELSFFADRYQQMKRMLLQQELFQDKVISDYIFIKSKLFAKINLSADEYELFEKLFEIAEVNLPHPDLVIFLQSPVARLQENIKTRGRAYEQQIETPYLQKLQSVYEEYLNMRLQRTLFINMEEVNFTEENGHLEQLIRFLDTDMDFHTHYLEIR